MDLKSKEGKQLDPGSRIRDIKTQRGLAKCERFLVSDVST